MSKSKFEFVWFLHSCLHMFYGERKESVSMTSLLSSIHFLRILELGHVMLSKLLSTQIVQYPTSFFWDYRPGWEGFASFTHLLIFFSQLNSYRVYHVSKRSINHTKKHVRNDEESWVLQESFRCHPQSELIHIYCSPSQSPKYQTSVDGMWLVRKLWVD